MNASLFPAVSSTDTTPSRGITRLEYNELGLPAVIKFDSGDRLEYAYDATGRKLSVELVPAPDSDAPAALPMALPGALTAGGALRSAVAERRDYYGAYELKNGSIDRINTPWGYFRGGYHAYIRDRQGSVRAVLNAKSGDRAEQRARYYPGGLPTHTPEGLDVNRYLHTSKELDTRLGLTLYDFEARLYDPQLGRFLSPDPMAGSYTQFSPYTFCAANPLRYSDPTGMRLEYDIEDVKKKEELIRTVNDLCQGSVLFNIMHGLLEKSETTFVVRFGETIKAEDGHQVSGLYDSQNKSITFNQNYEPPHARVLTEEYYHAYQDDYRYLNGGEWNREFEAKVMTSCMLNGPNVGFVSFENMNDFSDDLYNNPFLLIDSSFKDRYFDVGQAFAKAYQSNPNYGYPVNGIPNTLIKIVNIWKNSMR